MDGFTLRVLLPVLAASFASAAPRVRVARDAGAALRLGLPSNATSIRASEMLSERFSCAGRHYGYYADPDNDCQLFHVCLPVQFDDGRGTMYKWSFVCPEDTVFNQETFTCSRREDAIACQDSERFYGLNDDLGVSRRRQHGQDDSDEVGVDDDQAASEHGQGLGQAVEDQQQQQQQHGQHGMSRPAEARPPHGHPAHADGAFLLPQQQQQQQQVDTANEDEGTSKYGAFTTIRY